MCAYYLRAGRPVAPVLSLHDDLYNRRVLQHEEEKYHAKKCSMLRSVQEKRTLFLCLQLTLELLQTIAELPSIFLRQSILLFVLFQLLFDVFDRCLDLLSIQSFLHCNLVTGLVIDLIWSLLLFDILVDLDLTLFSKIPCTSCRILLHDPFLGAHAISELLITTDDHDATLKSLKSSHKSAETIAIQIVCRLIENDNMRILPA